jgi:hypothetical protein
MPDGGAVIDQGSQCKSGTSDLCSWDVVSDNYRSPEVSSGWSMFLPPAYTSNFA